LPQDNRSNKQPAQSQHASERVLSPKHIARDLDLDVPYLRELIRRYGYKCKPGRRYRFSPQEAHEIKKVITDHFAQRGR
jgi:hypothetical protein